MTQLNAFVARSFDSRDVQRIQPVLEFLETFRKAGFFCETAEAAEVEMVSQKVRRMIDERDVFVGFFTKRHPAYAFSSNISGAVQVLLGTTKPKIWSAPAWVLQESGYALGGKKKLILLRETDVEIPGLQGDLEYIPFDPEKPPEVFSKLSEMINGLLAEKAGTTVSMAVTERHEQAQVAVEVVVPQSLAEAPSETGEGLDLSDRFAEMTESASKHDLDAIVEAWQAGSALIADANHEGVDQVLWDALYFEYRFRAGASDALDDLRGLPSRHSNRFEPKRAIANCYYLSKEFDLASSLYLEVAASQDGEPKGRNLYFAAKALREIKKYDDAINAVRVARSIAPDFLRDDCISLLYQLLKERGDDYVAFATAETALHENPQLPVRFTLGLDYRLKGLNEIALHHFKFLYDHNNTQPGSLHNLALLSADCSLPISAVERYRTAFRLGNSLSASNLGYIYLDCGMAGEARALIDEAMKEENHVPAVEVCLAEITQRREREAEKETEILRQAIATRSFFLDMGRGLSASTPPVDGRWKFPFGEMPITVISGTLHGSADIKRQDERLSLLLSGLYPGGQQSAKVDTYVLSGKLTGAMCEFQVTIGEKGLLGVSGVVLANEPSKRGFIVFAPDGQSAACAEIADSKLGKIEVIKKKETNLLSS